MKRFLSPFLAIWTLFSVPASAQPNPPENAPIASPIAVSQTGRFSVSYPYPLILDKGKSLALTEFIAYKNPVSKSSIMLGAITGEQALKEICEKPTFLKTENIGDIASIAPSEIDYFETDQYKGCVFKIEPNKSAMILSVPQPFLRQDGSQIKFVGLIVDNANIHQLKTSVNFNIAAKPYFLNLLQLSQAFSPFSEKINWQVIKKQGMDFIGNKKTTCWGLSAAATYLIPELHRFDMHSYVTQDKLGQCPRISLPKDEGMTRWLSLPENIRNPIVKYSSEFHIYQLQDITYIYVPAMDAYDPNEINKKITEGRNALKKASLDKAQGLIVDLRFNTGGSVVPMLLALSSVIEEGKLFSMGKTGPVYLSRNRNTLFVGPTRQTYGEYNGAVEIKPKRIPIAILTNWITGSSGVITSLVLRNNNQVMTKVFGEETSPTASVNATFFLLDGNTFNLMVDRLYDNKDKVTPLKLPVDHIIKDDLETLFDPSTDKTINAAKKWLQSLR